VIVSSLTHCRIGKLKKKWASPFYRTAQPTTLAMFPSWGSSKGAGRKRLTRHKSIIIDDKCEENIGFEGE
jgi:hypothetical protein